MASIKSQMVLNDGMSRVLKKITNALDLTLQSFEQVQRASGQALNISQIDAARRGLVDANSEIRNMEDAYRRAKEQEDNLNQSIKNGTSAADGLLKKITSMAAAYMSFSTVKSFATSSMSAADTQIGAQTQLKTVMGNMGSSEYYDQIVAKAGDIQGKGIYGDEAMIAGAAELATYFQDGDAILSMMDTLSNYAMGMSGGGELDSTAMVDYATGIGKIMSGSYDAMNEKGFEFSDAQKAIIEGTATQQQIVAELGADYLGLSSDMQAAAVIGDVIDEGWAGLYETMSATPEGQIISFNNTLGDIKETIGAGIYPAVLNFMGVFQNNLPQIEALAGGFVNVLGVVLTMLTNIANGAITVGTAMVDNWGWIEPIIWGIVAALIAYNAVQGIGWLTTLKDIAAKGAHAVASAAETVAIIALIAAQDGLNAAMAACPITWIIVAVIALIAVIVALVRAFDVWGAESTSVIGTVCGLVAVAGAFIANLAIGVLNAILQAIWTIFVEPFLGIVEWILNVCNGGFNSFGDAVANLIGNIISWFLSLGKVVTKIIDAIFGTDWTGALSSLQDSVLSWGKNEDAITLDRNAPTIDYRIEYGDAFDTGAAFGDGIADKVGGLFNYDAGTLEDYTNAMDYNLSGMGDDLSGIADNTSGISDSLEVSTEELEYLRDIAERDAINRFTTAEVKIDMTGMTNKIDGSADIDGIITELTDGFTEALVTAAEGVHE